VQTETATKPTKPDAPAAPGVPTKQAALATIDQAIEAELVLGERAERPLIDQLAKLENADVLFERRAKMIESFYMTAIRRTRPEDWILFKDKQGNINAMLAASGAELVAEVYGIRVFNIRPMDGRGMFAPDRVELAGGAYELRGACDAFSRVNGREIFGLEISRRSDEQFTGRSVNDEGKFDFQGKTANPSDLRSAVLTGLRTKTVRVLCGMTRVPPSDLEKAWTTAGKDWHNCRKGSGFGTSSERKSEDLSSEDQKTEQKKLGDEILRRVGGDTGAAKKLCLEITANPPKFAGFESVARVTQGWQLEQAWKNLRAHKVFGDQNQDAGANG
jgi:hypothetical protein